MIRVQSGHEMTLGLMSVTVPREVFSLPGCRCCGNKEVPNMLSGLGRHDQEGALWEEMVKAGVVLATRTGRNPKLKVLHEQSFWID